MKYMKQLKEVIPKTMQVQHDNVIDFLEKGVYERAENSLSAYNLNYLNINPQVIYHRVGHDSSGNLPVTKLWQYMIYNNKGKIQQSLNELVRLIDYDNSIINEAISISATVNRSHNILNSLKDISSSHKNLSEYDNENSSIVYSFLSLISYIVRDEDFQMPSEIKNEIQNRHMSSLLL